MTTDNELAAEALRDAHDYHEGITGDSILGALELADQLESGEKRIVDATGHDTEALVKKCFEQECRIADLEKQLTRALTVVEVARDVLADGYVLCHPALQALLVEALAEYDRRYGPATEEPNE